MNLTLRRGKLDDANVCDAICYEAFKAIAEGHAVGESNSELQALIGAAQTLAGPGFLLPIRNTDLFRWCLQRGLRVTQPMTLMSLGLYNEPAGAFLPSVAY